MKKIRVGIAGVLGGLALAAAAAGQGAVDSQAPRAQALKDFMAAALGNPLIVGAHWHQFSDQATTGRFDGEYFQVGFTDVCDTPYVETVKALREVGESLYTARWGK